MSLSSTEAEYVTQAMAIQELKWIDLLLSELMVGDDLFRRPTTIFADNQGAMALASNPEFHSRSKHISIKYHYQRQEITAGTCLLTYIPTTSQAADRLTKPLPGVAFTRFVAQIGMRALPEALPN